MNMKNSWAIIKMSISQSAMMRKRRTLAGGP
jgi:hypothetical protein